MVGSNTAVDNGTLSSDVNYVVVVHEQNRDMETKREAVREEQNQDIDITIDGHQGNVSAVAVDVETTNTEESAPENSTAGGYDGKVTDLTGPGVMESKYKVIESDKNSLKISLMSTAGKLVTSRKGAEKRKARLPKPSPRSAKKRKNAKGKDKKGKASSKILFWTPV